MEVWEEQKRSLDARQSWTIDPFTPHIQLNVITSSQQPKRLRTDFVDASTKFNAIRSSSSSSSEEDEETVDAVTQYCRAQVGLSENNVILGHTQRYLDQCLYYHPECSMAEARHRLAGHQIGAFLLRPSSNPNFVLSLSVKTQRGTTAVRIAFRNKRFLLDADPTLKKQLPSFPSVAALIQFHLKVSSSVHKNRVVFLESSGRKDTPITLLKPALRETGSLKHLSRMAIHAALNNKKLVHTLPGASTNIIEFLQDYPHPI
jgi:hypothetical protein